MFKINAEEYSCPVEALSNILGKKWVATIIWTLQKEEKRFGQLQREIDGCTKKMLSQQLDLLMEQGIVQNEKVISGNTIESTYYLSETGLSLLPIVEQMIEWGNNHLTCD